MAKRMKLAPGAYRLATDVTNPHPRPRVKTDWTKHAVWKAGERFVVEREPSGRITIRRVGSGRAFTLHDKGSIYGNATQAEQLHVLAAALEPIAEDLDTMFERLGLAAYDLPLFLKHMVEAGAVTAAQLEQLFVAWNATAE